MSMMDIELSEELVTGAAELERTERGFRPHRLPAWVRRQFPDPQLLAMEAQPSGVTLAFRSRANRIELVSHPSRMTYAGAERPRGRIDLTVDGKLVGTDSLTGGDRVQIDLQTGTSELVPGPVHRTIFETVGRGQRDFTVWLPHNEALELISLAADAPLVPIVPSKPVWMHYGSSVSQGSNAAGPSDIWPVVAARTTGLQLRNVGLGGSALLDPFIARMIRDAPADIISVKVGINIVNLDSMRLRTFVPALHGFLDTIRDGHPTTPLLLASPIFCGIHENTPGPGAIDVATLGTAHVKFTATGEEGDTRSGRLTLRVIRDAMKTVAALREDSKLTYVDGLDLYGPADADLLPLPDSLHPDTETHELIGRRFVRHLAACSAPQLTV